MRSPLKPFWLMMHLVLAGIMFAGCKKENSRIRIDGFYLTNPNGDHVGHHGPEDDDWTMMAGDKAEADILALFNFPINVDVSDTKEVTMTGRVAAFPNPVSLMQVYFIQSTDKVLLKLVVVDRDLRILHTQANKLQAGGNMVSIDFSNRQIFSNKTSVRVYYSFSAPGKPNYQYGYGDSRICESPTGDCF